MIIIQLHFKSKQKITLMSLIQKAREIEMGFTKPREFEIPNFT